ncbi:hypothetical protein D3C81_2211250 [compost metagenome]
MLKQCVHQAAWLRRLFVIRARQNDEALYGLQLRVLLTGPWVACCERVEACGGHDLAQAGALGELRRYQLPE